jgi:oligopeptide transport system substrate-binding protein
MEIFSGLLKLDDSLEPAPDIALNLPEISSDGLTYTFNLRQDVTFHDGKSVTANDFKYSWERAVNPATQSQTAATYLGDIVGVSDVLAGKSSQISGLKIQDDYTLQITIDSPKSYFLHKLTYPTTFVVDSNNVKSRNNWWHKPNGTGPFKLSDWTQNQSLTLERNDLFYGDKPQLDQVKYQFYRGLPMDLYETDAIDVTGVSTNYIDKVLDQSGPFYPDLSTATSLSVYYIGFNCNQPPFDDVNVRRAFSMAIDKDKIVSLVFRDIGNKASGILPPGLPGYNQNVSGLNFDVNQALELIQTSKYGDVSNLPPITLTTSGYGGNVGSALQAIVFQWKQNLGVEVNIRQLEPERFFYNTKSEIDQMYDIGWSADYPHPQNFLDILFYTGSNYNYGDYSNQNVDSLISQANQSLNQEQSFALYQQAEQIIIDEAACMPLLFDETYLLVKPYVQGYNINPLGFANLSKVSITP